MLQDINCSLVQLVLLFSNCWKAKKRLFFFFYGASIEHLNFSDNKTSGGKVSKIFINIIMPRSVLETSQIKRDVPSSNVACKRNKGQQNSTNDRETEEKQKNVAVIRLHRQARNGQKSFNFLFLRKLKYTFRFRQLKFL